MTTKRKFRFPIRWQSIQRQQKRMADFKSAICVFEGWVKACGRPWEVGLPSQAMRRLPGFAATIQCDVGRTKDLPCESSFVLGKHPSSSNNRHVHPQAFHVSANGSSLPSANKEGPMRDVGAMASQERPFASSWRFQGAYFIATPIQNYCGTSSFPALQAHQAPHDE